LQCTGNNIPKKDLNNGISLWLTERDGWQSESEILLRNPLPQLFCGACGEAFNEYCKKMKAEKEAKKVTQSAIETAKGSEVQTEVFILDDSSSTEKSSTIQCGVPGVVTVLPNGWQTNVSRRTGQTYWFNVHTGASVYEEPPDLVALRKPIEIKFDPRDPRAYEQANAAVIASNENIPLYRVAAESIISALSSGRDTNPICKGIHRFPPTVNKFLRFVIEELAEDYGLKCCLNEKTQLSTTLSTVVDEMRHVVVWRDGCDPPEVAVLLAEEKQLNEEAETRRQNEIAAARTAILESKKRLKESGQVTNGEETVFTVGKVAIAASKDDIVNVVPLFAKKDKRSISEITDELKEKKRLKITDTDKVDG
jgi:hypothetical protein